MNPVPPLPPPNSKLDSPSHASTHSWLYRVRDYGPIFFAYLLLTTCTNAYFFGDTADYVRSILTHQELWDFGHLLWRPLGWLGYQLFGSLAQPFVGANQTADATLILLIISWCAGLIGLLTLHALLRRVCHVEWAVNVACLFFCGAQAFLNFAQTGSSYILGLCFLLIGFYCSLRGGEAAATGAGQARFNTAAGLALAGAVGCWLPYFLALPAALATPYFLTPAHSHQRRATVQTGGVLIFATALLYGGVIVLLRLHNLADVRAWIAASSHDIPASKSVVRMVFGLARSFINMGNDGILFKRFLLHDPLNPVSLSDLIRLSLWKLMLFYGFLAALVFSLMHHRQGRHVLGLLLFNAVPVLVFAVFWQGGDMERYLALYPALIVALAYALAHPVARWLQVVCLLFGALMLGTNVLVMAKPNLHRQEMATAARVAALPPHLKPHSLIVVTHLQDELINFNRSYPFNPLNQDRRLYYYDLVSVGNKDTGHWRQDFAHRAFDTWHQGGAIWLSRRVFKPRPLPQWGWAEGADAQVRWTDLFHFFAPLQRGAVLGGDDGFVLLPASPYNQQVLRKVWHETPKFSGSGSSNVTIGT